MTAENHNLPTVIIDGAAPRSIQGRCWRIYAWASGTSLFTREQLSRLVTLAEDSETISEDDDDQWWNEDRMLEVVGEAIPHGYELHVYAGDVIVLESEGES